MVTHLYVYIVRNYALSIFNRIFMDMVNSTTFQLINFNKERMTTYCNPYIENQWQVKCKYQVYVRHSTYKQRRQWFYVNLRRYYAFKSQSFNEPNLLSGSRLFGHQHMMIETWSDVARFHLSVSHQQNWFDRNFLCSKDTIFCCN